jgi:hypothetical protein
MGNFPREQIPTFISVTGTGCNSNGVCETGGPTWNGQTPFSRAEINFWGTPGKVWYDVSQVHLLRAARLPVHNHLHRSMAPMLVCRSRQEMAAARPSRAMDYPMDARFPGLASLVSGTRAFRPAAHLRTRATWARSRLAAAVVLRTLGLAPTAHSSTRLARTRTHSRTTMVSNMHSASVQRVRSLTS